MFHKFPILTRFISFILIPIILIITYIIHLFFYTSLPNNQGERYINGIDNVIEISRDNKGIVYINADTDKDVYFSMGYVHAQDRLWQLELQRRISQGRLSEIFGKEAVAKDIWFRTLGLHKAAKQSILALSSEAIGSLEAYADGINAWVNEADQLPIEFSTFGIQPEPWKIEDSLSWMKIFAINLSGNFSDDIQAVIGKKYLTDNQLSTFFPHLPKDTLSANWDENITDLFLQLNLLQLELEKRYKIGGRYVGSNAWVVSGKLTKSGQSILANDPHLGLQIPSLWYVVNQKGDKLNVQGMSLVGIPLVIFGRNQHIAWGGTNMMADIQDLYIEEINPSNPKQYKLNGDWLLFETVKETIKVTGDFPAGIRNKLQDINIIIRSTETGPIISDHIKSLEQPISLKWTGLDKNDTSYDAILKLNYASNWLEFNQALEYYISPALNMFYIDNDNNIGSVGIGKIPVREKGQGMLPVLRTDSAYTWKHYIPFDEMPRIYNPEKGYIINANNKNTTIDYPYFISNNFAPGARAKRIEDLLTQKKSEKLTIEDMKLIQADFQDLSAYGLLDYLKSFEGRSNQEKQILSILNKWQGEASTESVGASLFYGWFRHLKQNIFNDELSGYWNQKEHANFLMGLPSKVSADHLAKLLMNNSNWCDDITSLKVESCQDIIGLSLITTLNEMTELKGADINNWQWGQIQNTVYAHEPFSRFKHIDKLFERTISNGGSSHTINVSGSSFDKDEGYQQRFGAGFRQIMDFSLGEPIHLFMNSTGQSGQVGSNNYDDMVEDFRNVDYIKFVKQPNKFTSIILRPKSGNL